MAVTAHEDAAPVSWLSAACSLYLSVTKAVLEVLGITALAVMVVINAAEIVVRLLTSNSLQWVQELSIILAVFIYFALYALVAKERSYIYLDLLKFRNPTARRAIGLATQIAVIAFHVALLIYALRAASFAWLFETPLLQLPEAVYLLPIVVGSADIIVTETIHVVRTVVGGTAADQSRAGILT